MNTEQKLREALQELANEYVTLLTDAFDEPHKKYAKNSPVYKKAMNALALPITPPAAAHAPAVPQGNDPAWTLAAKVREALDRKSRPGYYMDVAVEAVVHNYTPAAPSQEPDMHIGACITDGALHATVMRREANGHVTILATAEMDAKSLLNHDCVAKLSPAAPSQPVACGLCQGSGVLSPTQKCICQYGGKEPVTLTDQEILGATQPVKREAFFTPGTYDIAIARAAIAALREKGQA